MKRAIQLLLCLLLARSIVSMDPYAQAIENQRRRRMDREVICLARAIYFEARGEDQATQLAVGFVVLNRSQDRRRNLCEVVHENMQFSPCLGGCSIRDPEAYATAATLARTLVYEHEKLTDPTGGALYFHDHRRLPYWAFHFSRTLCTDGLIFYRPRRSG